MNPKVKDICRALLEWLDREPLTLAIAAAGLACLIALPILMVTGS